MHHTTAANSKCAKTFENMNNWHIVETTDCSTSKGTVDSLKLTF